MSTPPPPQRESPSRPPVPEGMNMNRIVQYMPNFVPRPFLTTLSLWGSLSSACCYVFHCMNTPQFHLAMLLLTDVWAAFSLKLLKIMG